MLSLLTPSLPVRQWLALCVCASFITACSGDADSIAPGNTSTTNTSGSASNTVEPGDLGSAQDAGPNSRDMGGVTQDDGSSSLDLGGPAQPPPAICPAQLALPAVQGCDGTNVLDLLNSQERTDNIEEVEGPFAGLEGLRFREGERITLKSEPCFQPGLNGGDFAFSGWVKIPENNSIFVLQQERNTLMGLTTYERGGSTRLQISIKDDKGENNTAYINVMPGEWMHVAVSYQNRGKRSNVTLWANQRRTSVSFDGMLPDRWADAEPPKLYIGERSFGQGTPVDIAGFKGYGRALKRTEVEAMLLEQKEAAGLDVTSLEQALSKLEGHIKGGEQLGAEAFVKAARVVFDQQLLMIEDQKLTARGLELIALYERERSPLFSVEGEQSFRTEEEDRAKFFEQFGMLELHDALLNVAFHPAAVTGCRQELAGISWRTSDRFPGAVTGPKDPDKVHVAKVNATVPRAWGREHAFVKSASKQPTGLYLAPGSVAQVRVPEALVGKGYTVTVGGHSPSHRAKRRITRPYNMQTRFGVEHEVTFIANPMGGLVHVEVPYLATDGIVDFEIKNVVEAPYFSMRSWDKTTPEEWKQRRQAPGPWAEFVTDKFWLEVPTEWIYAMEDPSEFLSIWNESMESVDELMGYTTENPRNRVTHFSVVDTSIKGNAGTIGYPSINNAYDPDKLQMGKSGHPIFSGQLNSWFEYHELGHAQRLKGFGNEQEATIHILLAHALNTRFGKDFDEAFRISGPGQNFLPDDAALHWMITERFQTGQEMTNSGTRRQIQYQYRGYAKYTDIARLFGWKALRTFYRQWSEEIEAGMPAPLTSSVDMRILRLSRAAGADLRPLIHFWGRHPEDNEALAMALKMEGIGSSPEVRMLLERYRDDVVPADKVTLEARFERAFPTDKDKAGEFTAREFVEAIAGWKPEVRTAMRKTIDDVIALYYP